MSAAPFDLRFAVHARAGAARAGEFTTPHGTVRTPAFMPVGTRATVKGLTNAQLAAIAPEVLLANTYHLHLRPGEDVVRRLGGLHRFAGWDRPILTDSGGFQVFSLGELVAVDEGGTTVRSHLDGEPVRLGPREATAIQEALGADLVMAFDQCCRLPATPREVSAAVDRTARWAEVCLAARTRDDQAMLGIVQGGVDPVERRRSAAQITALPFSAYAIGGLSVGEGPEVTRTVLSVTTPLLPADRPRYLMGVGAPLDLLDAVATGVDLFDCVIGTRNGRRGHLFTRDGVVRIGRAEHALDEGPLDAECACEACRGYSRAYLHHLFAVGEHTATTLGSLHNVHFLVTWVRDLRAAILAGTFETVATAMRARYEAGEARWASLHAEDPEGRAGSRRAAQERAERRRKVFGDDDPS
ncbi:MAG: tRNA guanosine(34) transglycosylase Tgt [Planctomycetes bacterium]|nr:tRNA guanosine(34) transglycosylase Tgt [Planctomycetota bacterium]